LSLSGMVWCWRSWQITHLSSQKWYGILFFWNYLRNFRKSGFRVCLNLFNGIRLWFESVPINWETNLIPIVMKYLQTVNSDELKSFASLFIENPSNYWMEVEKMSDSLKEIVWVFNFNCFIWLSLNESKLAQSCVFWCSLSVIRCQFVKKLL
jgi:hypothetical protein